MERGEFETLEKKSLVGLSTYRSHAYHSPPILKKKWQFPPSEEIEKKELIELFIPSLPYRAFIIHVSRQFDRTLARGGDGFADTDLTNGANCYRMDWKRTSESVSRESSSRSIFGYVKAASTPGRKSESRSPARRGAADGN